MNKVIFSTWKGELIDNRGKSEDEVVESNFKFPFSFDDGDAKAFIGWDGFVIFDESIDAIKLGCEYAATYQNYSEACGRCTPGRWGGRILYDMFDKIARGDGEWSDVDHLKEISKTMMLTSKCEIGKTVPKPLLDILEHFGDDIKRCIEDKKPSFDYKSNKRYIS